MGDRGYSYISTVLRMLKTNLGTPLGIGCARFLANLFSSFTNRASLFEKRLMVLENLREFATIGGMHKQVKVALATTLLNLSTAFVGLKEKNGRKELLETCDAFLQGPLDLGKNADDFEAVYRVLVAAGNIACDSTETGCAIGGTMRTLAAACSDARSKEAASDIAGL